MHELVSGGGFLHTMTGGYDMSSFWVSSVGGVEVLKFVEFHDFGGLFNFATKWML